MHVVGLCDGWPLATIRCVASMTTIKIKNIYMPVRKLVTAAASTNVFRTPASEPARFGKSAVKRAAIGSGSRCADRPPGSAAISDANLSDAVSSGSPAKLVAYCQGSRSSRASAEITLSSMPLASSPIGANRKSSNSDPRLVAQTGRIISITKVYLYNTQNRQ